MNVLQPKSIFKHLAFTVAAVAITFCLFVAIPILHGLFGFSIEPPGGVRQRPQIPIETMAPPKKEEKKIEERLRKVKSDAMDKALAGSERAMGMKFTPDLSVEGSANGAAVAMQGQELQAEVFEEGQVDEDVVPIFQPPIEYPERARELGVQGVLEVVFVVDLSGRATQLDIRKSPHPVISAEARRVIAQWKFKPARNKGVPVRLRVKQEIEFKLD